MRETDDSEQEGLGPGAATCPPVFASWGATNGQLSPHPIVRGRRARIINCVWERGIRGSEKVRASPMVTRRLGGRALDCHLPERVLALWDSSAPGFESCLGQGEGPRLVLGSLR